MVTISSILRRHARWTPILDRVADGSATPAEQASFAGHRQRCTACTETFAQTVALRAALAASPPIVAPRSFRIDERMLATRIADEASATVVAATRRPLRAIRIAQATAGLAALTLAALLGAPFASNNDATDSTATTSLLAAEARLADAPADQSSKSSPAFGTAIDSGAGAPGGAVVIPTSTSAGTGGAAAGAVPPQPAAPRSPTNVAGSSGPAGSDNVDAASTDLEPPTVFPTPVPPSTGVGDSAGRRPSPIPQAVDNQGANAYAVPGDPASSARNAAAGAEPPHAEIGAPSVLDGDGNDGPDRLLIAEIATGVLLAAALTAWIALTYTPRRS